MNYLTYPTKNSTPSRLTRKQQRNKVFVTNKRLKRVFRKKRLFEKKTEGEA